MVIIDTVFLLQHWGRRFILGFVIKDLGPSLVFFFTNVNTAINKVVVMAYLESDWSPQKKLRWFKVSQSPQLSCKSRAFKSPGCFSAKSIPSQLLLKSLKMTRMFRLQRLQWEISQSSSGSAVRDSKLQVRSRGKQLQHTWFHTSATICAVGLWIGFCWLAHSLWIISAVFRPSSVRWLPRVVWCCIF